MKIYIKGLNACVMRNQKLFQYEKYFTTNKHVLVNSPKACDVIVVWTCAFRADHRDGSIMKIKNYVNNNHNAKKIVITGCLPDIAPELLDFPPDRVFVVNWKQDSEKLDHIFKAAKPLRSIRSVFSEEALCRDAAEYRKQNISKDATFHDQFIKLLVSEGCNHKCTYCSERLAFPEYRSFSPKQLYNLCKSVVEKTGVYDVILLADSLGQYGCDIGTNFPELVKHLKNIHPDLKFAFNNLHLHDFLEFYDEMANLILSGYIKHLNLPVQSGSDCVLKAMNRTYTKKDIETVFGLLKKLNFSAFDTHIIVGFPGETEDDFQQTIDLLIKYSPQYVLASKYMESKSAPSAVLKDKVDDGVALERLWRAKEHMEEKGIICNYDGSELSKNRLELLHQD